MTRVLAAVVVLLSGTIAGGGLAVVWLVLNLPGRTMDIFGVTGEIRYGWAVLLGTMAGTLLPIGGLTVGLGTASGAIVMLLSGVMTGMLASSLAEVMGIVPQALARMRVTRAEKTACWAMAVGKAIGALLACLAALR